MSSGPGPGSALTTGHTALAPDTQAEEGGTWTRVGRSQCTWIKSPNLNHPLTATPQCRSSDRRARRAGIIPRTQQKRMCPGSLTPQATLRDIPGAVPKSPSSMSPKPSLSIPPEFFTQAPPPHRGLGSNRGGSPPSCGTAFSRPSPARRPTSLGPAGSAAAGRWGGPACPSN